MGPPGHVQYHGTPSIFLTVQTHSGFFPEVKPWDTLGQAQSTKATQHGANRQHGLLCTSFQRGVTCFVAAGARRDLLNHRINILGWKGGLKAVQSNPLPWALTSSTGSGCSETGPTWPGMFPGMGHRPPLWATWFQGLTTLMVKNLFLISSLNLLSSSVKPLPLLLPQQALL